MTQKMDAKITKLTVFQFHIRDIEIEVIVLETSIMDKCRYICTFTLFKDVKERYDPTGLGA